MLQLEAAISLPSVSGLDRIRHPSTGHNIPLLHILKLVCRAGRSVSGSLRPIATNSFSEISYFAYLLGKSSSCFVTFPLFLNIFVNLPILTSAPSDKSFGITCLSISSFLSSMSLSVPLVDVYISIILE
jgi:hypothetical protein